MADNDREMLNELIVESREHLENIEPDLLELEQNGNNVSSELINRVFRAVHSIKGGFGFFGIETIVRLAHAMENVMSRVRDKEIEVTGDLTDALLLGIDKLSLLLNDVGNSENVSIETELAKLHPFLSTEAQKTAPKEGGSQTKGDFSLASIQSEWPGLSDDIVSELIKNGKLLYLVSTTPAVDFPGKTIVEILDSWEKFGDILQMKPARAIQQARQVATLQEHIPTRLLLMEKLPRQRS